MTKRTFHYVIEAGWLFIALLPVILYIVAARNTGGTDMLTFTQMMNEKLGFFTSSNNIIYSTLTGIFGQTGELPILSEAFAAYLSYFIIVEIAHLCVDVLLFIPRLAHNWLEAYTRRNA